MRVEPKLQLFAAKELRNVFAPNKEEVSEKFIFHNDEVSDLCM